MRRAWALLFLLPFAGVYGQPCWASVKADTSAHVALCLSPTDPTHPFRLTLSYRGSPDSVYLGTYRWYGPNTLRLTVTSVLPPNSPPAPPAPTTLRLDFQPDGRWVLAGLSRYFTLNQTAP